MRKFQNLILVILLFSGGISCTNCSERDGGFVNLKDNLSWIDMECAMLGMNQLDGNFGLILELEI